MLTTILTSAASLSLGIGIGMAYTLSRWRQASQWYITHHEDEMLAQQEQFMAEVRRRVRAEQHIRVLLGVNDILN